MNDDFLIKDGVLERYLGDKKRIVIPENVTSIGESAFTDYEEMTSVDIPCSVINIGAHAFEGCIELKSVTMREGVTRIGEHAFDYCVNLTNITIPDSVTQIGDYAFSECHKLKNVTLSSNLISTGVGTFYECISIKSITIPNGVTTIDISAFEGCIELNKVTIPNSVKHIGGSAFERCVSLKNITIPYGVTDIWGEAFKGCRALESVRIPESVMSIGMYAFACCESLKSVTIPSYIKSIASHVFDECTGLADKQGLVIVNGVVYDCKKDISIVSIPDDVTDIWEDAFEDCKNLTNITIPGSVTRIGNGAFKHCNSLTSITIPEGVINIGDSTFEECNGLTSVMIADSVKSIGDSAFAHCESMTGIKIPDSVTSIGDSAFKMCTSLASITIPDRVISIGDCAFEYCTSLTSIVIPDSITNIGVRAFYKCGELANEKGFVIVRNVLYYYKGDEETVTIPEGVTCIGEDVFSDCSKLTNVIIPDSVISLEKGAFRWCAKLKGIMIPKRITHIADSLFCDCRSLTDMTIPNGVKSIGELAFCECINLKSIAIPNSVTSIGTAAFRECSSLKSVMIPDGVTSIGDLAFFDCANMTSITLSENVKSIGDSAFEKCSNLKSISIPEGATRIGEEAFSGCGNLAEIIIPESISRIGKAAFKNCKQLRTLIMKGTKCELTDGILKGCINLCEIHVQDINCIPMKLRPCAAATFAEEQPDQTTERAKNHIAYIKNNAKELQKVARQRPALKILLEQATGNVATKPAEYRSPETAIFEQYGGQNAYDALKLPRFVMPKIKLRNSEAFAPDELLKTMLIAYCSQYQKEKEYVSGPCREVDEASERLDPDSFQAALADLLKQVDTQKYRKTLVFFARYGNSTILRKIIEDGNGSRASEAAVESIYLYNDSKEAMLLAYHRKEEEQYARVRGMTIADFEDRVFADFGFNTEGIKRYDLDGKVYEARVTPELDLKLTNLTTRKSLKMFSPDSKASAKYTAAVNDFADMRLSIKRAVKIRQDKLFAEFLSDEQITAERWRNNYINNPVLKGIARLLVWQQEKQTFTIKDDKLIDSRGGYYNMTEAPVTVAHPMEMDKDDVKAWQKYFTDHGLKQPFIQIWEPVYEASKIRPDRYADAVIPYKDLMHREAEGIDADIHWVGRDSFDLEGHFFLKGCVIDYETVDISDDTDYSCCENNYGVKLEQFTFEEYNRQVNHIVYLMDQVTHYHEPGTDDGRV